MSLLGEPDHGRQNNLVGTRARKELVRNQQGQPVAHGSGLVTNQEEKLVPDQRSRPEAPETDLGAIPGRGNTPARSRLSDYKRWYNKNRPTKREGRQEKLVVASRCQPLCSKRRVTLKDKENKKERTAKEKPQTGAIKEKPKERRKERPLKRPKAKGQHKPRLHPLQGKGPWWKLSLTPKPGLRPSWPRQRQI